MRRDPSTVKLPSRLKRVEQIAHLFDDRFRIPGTNFRFGLDPLFNLIPLLGDASGFIVGAALVWVMARQGVSRKVVILMALNVGIDALLGAIPIIGQISDFYFKSNTRNLKLLKEHYMEDKHQGSGTGILVFMLFILLMFFAACIFISVKIIQFIFK